VIARVCILPDPDHKERNATMRYFHNSFSTSPNRLARFCLTVGRGLKRCVTGVKTTVVFLTMCNVHVFGDILKYMLKNWKAFAIMALSLALLAIGFVRLQFYSVPMLRSDYEYAAKGKTEFDFADKETAPELEIYGKDSKLDQIAIATIQAARRGIDGAVGDRVGGKFNRGYSLYLETRYDDAARELSKAYAALTDSEGKVKPKYEKLASQIQFLIGNAYANQKKEGEAISAYQLSLTHDPDNLVTIYNLERLLSNGGGKGGKDGDKPKPSNPQNTKL